MNAPQMFTPLAWRILTASSFVRARVLLVDAGQALVAGALQAQEHASQSQLGPLGDHLRMAHDGVGAAFHRVEVPDPSALIRRAISASRRPPKMKLSSTKVRCSVSMPRSSSTTLAGDICRVLPLVELPDAAEIAAVRAAAAGRHRRLGLVVEHEVVRADIAAPRSRRGSGSAVHVEVGHAPPVGDEPSSPSRQTKFGTSLQASGRGLKASTNCGKTASPSPRQMASTDGKMEIAAA